MARERRLSGWQITIIVVAICAAVVGAPAAVMATTGAVNIADPTAPAQKAKVNPQGELKTVTADAISGKPAKVTDAGQQVVTGAVTISGKPAVTSSPGLPGTPYTKEANGSSSFTVPAGKHLTVESVSINVDVTSGHDLEAYISFTTHGASGILYIPLVYSNTASGFDTYIATVPVHFYADPSTSVTLSMGTNSGTTGTPFLTVTGYLT